MGVVVQHKGQLPLHRAQYWSLRKRNCSLAMVKVNAWGVYALSCHSTVACFDDSTKGISNARGYGYDW